GNAYGIGYPNAGIGVFKLSGAPSQTQNATLEFSFSDVGVGVVNGRKQVTVTSKSVKSVPVEFAATIKNDGPSTVPAGRVQLQLSTYPSEAASFLQVSIVSSPDGKGGTIQHHFDPTQVRLGIRAKFTWFLQ